MNESRVFRNGMISVQFRFAQDRYSHEIGVIQGGQHFAFLRSVEGDNSQPWPCSPPFQQIVEEAVNGNSVLFGVGLSGNGHWSCALDKVKNGATRMDVACRVSKPAGHLGSRYQVVAPFEIMGASLTTRGLHLAMRGSVQGAFSIELTAGLGLLNIEKDQLHFDIFPDGDVGKITTHRWCYEFLVK